MKFKAKSFLACAVLSTIFCGGWLTPRADAANFGCGETVQFLDNDVLNKDSTRSMSSATSQWAVVPGTADANYVIFHGVKFKIVAVDNPSAGKNAKITLWSYETDGTKFYNPTTAANGVTADGKVAFTKTSQDVSIINTVYKNGQLNAAMGALYSSTFGSDSRIQEVSLTSEIVNNTMGTETINYNMSAFVWAPSYKEVNDDGTWCFNSVAATANAQRAIGVDSWLRTTSGYDHLKDAYTEDDGYAIPDNKDSTTELLLRPALQIVNEINYVFTSKGEIASDGVFAADEDSGTEVKYEIVNSANKPIFTPATNGIILDGKKIGVNVTPSTTDGYSTAGLLTTADGVTWEDLNGTMANIAYMAKASDGNFDLQNVTSEIDYTLKIFGIKGTNVTELADNAISCLSIGSDGKIHLKVNGTLNNGVTVTLKNGAVVDLTGDAENNITIGNGDSGVLNLNTHTHSGTINNAGILNVTGNGILAGTYGGSGTAEFNGTVGVADGVQLGMATNNVNGTLDVQGHITASNINFKNGSTLKVDGNQIIGTAAINVSSATVESGAKLYVSNAVKDTHYKILAGTGINVNSWQTDADMGEGFKAAYGLKLDTSSIINDGSQFTIKFVKDSTAIDNIDIGDLLSNASPSSALYKYVDTLSQVQLDRAAQATVINTMANMNSLANVQQGTQAVMAMATDALQTNIGTGARPMLGHRAEGIEHNSGDRYQGSGVRKVSANDKDSAAIETVEQGKSDEVMPTMVENEEQKYDKTVWANYIHSKKTIDGLKTGRLTQNSTIQYNGVTVGVDLWSNAKGFGGLALTTAEGKTNSSQDGASVKNDTDYHGISLYQRYDYKDVAILFDLSYTHAKNDVTMSTAGTTDVTAKPKSDAYSAGVKVEYPVKIGHSSQLTPYTGVRYTHIHTDKYDNSLGISNDIKDQNLVNIPIGVQLKTEYTTNTDWKFGHIFEGGYVWNVGNRQSEQRLGYLGVYDSIDFDVTDRGEYFLKTAFTARHKDTDFELGYRYTKGDNTKDNKWNFNVTYNFGNANGLPYKSVLLGKIDLLESANKALRAELVEKDLRIRQLEEELRNLKNK